MLYLMPTKKGIGVEIWGTFEDLDQLYDLIGEFWTVEDEYKNIPGEESRNIIIGSFAYDIRKAYEGQRLVRDESHLYSLEQLYLGCEITWPHFLFTLSCIRYNMQFSEVSKLALSKILELEFWLEEAMKEYDPVGALRLAMFTQNVLYGGNPYIFQYMRSIDNEFMMLGGGKRAFRKLPELLKKGIALTDEYLEYEEFLIKEAKRLGCNISQLELNDDDVDYDGEW